jgi:hypothetical protein
MVNPKTFAREVRSVEFVARHLWPYLRFFVKRHLSRRCCNCILPESFAEIDDDGVCAVCRRSQEETKADATTESLGELHALLCEAQRSGRRDYDVLVLFSGGKDSTYLLHRLRHEYPNIRVVTLLVDNGFLSPFALENASRIRERLDVDHISFKPRPTFTRMVFRYALTHLDRQSGYSIVDLLDAFITFDTAKRVAAQLEIPLVACGVSKVQAKNVFNLNHFELCRDAELSALQKHGGISLDDITGQPGGRVEPREYWWDASKWPKELVPRFILPFVAWDPSEDDILAELSRLALVDTRQMSPLMTNNLLIPVIGIAEVARFGFSCFEVEFAEMIRKGKVQRCYWANLFEMLEYSAKTGRYVNRTVVDTLQALDLTKNDIGIGVP